MLEAVLSNGMGMLVAFKEKDVSRSGNLNASIFKDVLRELSPGLSFEDNDMMALKFQDPNTKEIQYEGVLKYFYKKAFQTSPTSSLMTTTTDLCHNNKTNGDNLSSKSSTAATVKEVDEYSSQLKLNDEKTAFLKPLPMVDTVQDNKSSPPKLTPPSPPIQEVLGRLSVFIMNRRAHVEELMQERDSSLSGVIPTRAFSEVLHSFTEIKLSRSERKILYDSFSQSGYVAYKEFLNLFTPPTRSSSQPTTSIPTIPTSEMASNSTKGSKGYGYMVECRYSLLFNDVNNRCYYCYHLLVRAEMLRSLFD